MVSRLSWCTSLVWVDTVAIGATLNKSSDFQSFGEDICHSSKVKETVNEHG